MSHIKELVPVTVNEFDEIDFASQTQGAAVPKVDDQYEFVSLSLQYYVNERHYISTILKRSKSWILPILVGVLIVLNVVVLTAHAQKSEQLAAQRSITVKTRNELQGASERLERVKTEKVDIKSSLKEERLKTAEKDEKIKSLKVSLQAKKEREAKAAAEAKKAQLASAQVVEKQKKAESKPAPTVTITGNKQSWLAASGIPQSQWGYVDSIVSRESGWNPNAVNPTSGACGLGQQLPCGKWPGAWNDPVAALKAQHDYVKARYGSYAGAVAFWNANHYY